MTTTIATSSTAAAGKATSPEKALRRLFLTLFLRGRSARGLRLKRAPRSIGRKLAVTLFFYALLGCLAFSFSGQGIFILAVYLHAMTFAFLGMFVSASAGEILFNKDEADILMHRPVTAKALLWAKIGVLVNISLWLAGAFNLAGMFVGAFATNSDWRFLLVHAVSTTLEALFCTGSVVMVYQLCIRWFGRERLEGLMTTAQIIVSITMVFAAQVLPQIAFRFSGLAITARQSWWFALLPPAWFAGLDDAVAGSMGLFSGLLGLVAIAATGAVLWIAFSKLSRDYQSGLQRLNENVSRAPRSRGGRRWIDRLVNAPPLRWWLRDPVRRASFLLTTAYLVRDRDVKLRVYPSIAPMLVIPFIFMLRGNPRVGGGFGTGFGPGFAGAYVGIIPMLTISVLQYSQQWQAADIFRCAPVRGPAAICDGARWAVLCFITAPVVILFAVATWFMHRDFADLALILPGVAAIPVYAMIPSLLGKAIPLSRPTEEGKSTGRGMLMIVVTIISFALAALAGWAWKSGWFWWFLLGECAVILTCYGAMRVAQARQQWPSME